MTTTLNKKTTSRRQSNAGLDKGVFDFFSQEIERLKTLGRHRASETCRSTLNALKAFRKEKDLTFRMINSDMMEQFEAHLRQRGIVRNTTSYYIRCVRSVYNRAVRLGLTADNQPFLHVYTSQDKTIKRALCQKDIKAIKRLNLSARPALEFARDMFLFSFYTRGMSFVDMAYLRKQDVRGNILCYRRKKTGQLLTIEWVECMEEIAAKYRHKSSTQFLLPIIIDSNKDNRRQYQNRMRNLNRNLKAVGKLANISVPLSSYFARHSWASLAHELNIPISVISEGLGHNNEKTTQIYLTSIQSTVVDSANRRILEELG